MPTLWQWSMDAHSQVYLLIYHRIEAKIFKKKYDCAAEMVKTIKKGRKKLFRLHRCEFFWRQCQHFSWQKGQVSKEMNRLKIRQTILLVFLGEIYISVLEKMSSYQLRACNEFVQNWGDFMRIRFGFCLDFNGYVWNCWGLWGWQSRKKDHCRVRL